jgi:NAD+ synthase
VKFDPQVIDIDPKAETERIVLALRQNVRQLMHRRGAVVGISGGIDSSVVLALSTLAFGPEYVTAVMMPEKDSDVETKRLSDMVARRFGIDPVLEDITPIL